MKTPSQEDQKKTNSRRFYKNLSGAIAFSLAVTPSNLSAEQLFDPSRERTEETLNYFLAPGEGSDSNLEKTIGKLSGEFRVDGKLFSYEIPEVADSRDTFGDIEPSEEFSIIEKAPERVPADEASKKLVAMQRREEAFERVTDLFLSRTKLQKLADHDFLVANTEGRSIYANSSSARQISKQFAQRQGIRRSGIVGTSESIINMLSNVSSRNTVRENKAYARNVAESFLSKNRRVDNKAKSQIYQLIATSTLEEFDDRKLNYMDTAKKLDQDNSAAAFASLDIRTKRAMNRNDLCELNDLKKEYRTYIERFETPTGYNRFQSHCNIKVAAIDEYIGYTAAEEMPISAPEPIVGNSDTTLKNVNFNAFGIDTSKVSKETANAETVKPKVTLADSTVIENPSGKLSNVKYNTFKSEAVKVNAVANSNAVVEEPVASKPSLETRLVGNVNFSNLNAVNDNIALSTKQTYAAANDNEALDKRKYSVAA